MKVKFFQCPVCKGRRRKPDGLWCEACAGLGWKTEVLETEDLQSRKEENHEGTKYPNGERKRD